ncbi:MAG: hypothetical protein ABI409_03255 [Ramlibacter sp.]
MKFISFKAAAPVVALGFLLSGCGGGDDEGIFVNEKEPSSTGLSASVAVTAATNAVLNGTYTSNNILLNNVTKVDPIGGDPETCRFRFSGLVQPGSTRILDGDVRYIPGNPELRTTFVSISTIQFVLNGTAGATVDRANNRVVYTGAVFTSVPAGNAETITLTGTIPMRGDRPEGC